MKKRRLNTAYTLHARPAAMISGTANQFESDIMIAFNGRKVNAKSPVSVLSRLFNTH